MDIADCYRLLQLTSRANIDDLKASYRRLARQWHPDINPGDAFAHEKFIQVTEAYKTLQKIVPAAPSRDRATTTSTPTATVRSQPKPQVKVSVRQPVKPSPPPYRKPPAQSSPQRTPSPQTPPARTVVQPTAVPQRPPSNANSSSNPKPSSPPTPPLSAADIKLKVDSYRQLQDLIQRQRFPRAVALIEALAQRLPQDAEIRQWQAIIYQSWGRQLIRERKLNQAKAYLRKALSTDPHNKSLWAEIEQDFKNLEMVF